MLIINLAECQIVYLVHYYLDPTLGSGEPKCQLVYLGTLNSTLLYCIANIQKINSTHSIDKIILCIVLTPSILILYVLQEKYESSCMSEIFLPILQAAYSSNIKHIST